LLFTILASSGLHVLLLADVKSPSGMAQCTVPIVLWRVAHFLRAAVLLLPFVVVHITHTEFVIVPGGNHGTHMYLLAP
jgi:hypothetical protein